MPLLAEFGQLDLDTANASMIGEYFGRLDTAAALPGLRSIVEDWRPDVIVRDPWEYASTLVAELHDIPVVRVALGLAAVEELVDPARRGRRSTRRAPASACLPTRAATGFATRPTSRRSLRRSRTRPSPRCRGYASLPARGPPPPRSALGDWWPGNDDPLVYVTFGSVTAGAHLSYFPALYRTAIDALAALPARVLLTIGDRRDHDGAGPAAAQRPRRGVGRAGRGGAARRGDRRPRRPRDDARGARPRRAARRRAAVQRRSVGERRRRRRARARASRSTRSAPRGACSGCPGPEPRSTGSAPRSQRVLADPAHRPRGAADRRRDGRAAAGGRRGRRAGGDRRCYIRRYDAPLTSSTDPLAIAASGEAR